MPKCTHYSFVVQVGQTSNVKATLNNMQKHVCIVIAMFLNSVTHPHALHSDNFLDEKQENPYLDAGVVPCGNSTYDL